MRANEERAVLAAPEPEAIPLSLLNDFLFCPRRAALKQIEGLRSENRHTVLPEITSQPPGLVRAGVSLFEIEPSPPRAALSKVEGLKVTGVENLTTDQLAAYQDSAQESL